MSTNAIPERTIIEALKTGIAAIKADPTVLDGILADLETEERAKARALWAAHPPTVVSGYPRRDQVMPLWAVVLQGDANNQDYLSAGEKDDLIADDGHTVIGTTWTVRLQATYTVFVYTEHPDICLWWYRVARRIVNVARAHLRANKLYNPRVDGAELAPDPEYTPENLYVRRISLTFEYEETWDDQDALYAAFYPTPTARLTEDATLVVQHEDTGGGVHPMDE